MKVQDIYAGKKRTKDADPNLSHHEQPRKPGSDDNHSRENEHYRDDRRVWKERHTGPKIKKS